MPRWRGQKSFEEKVEFEWVCFGWSQELGVGMVKSIHHFDGEKVGNLPSDRVVVYEDSQYSLVFDLERTCWRDSGHMYPLNWEVAYMSSKGCHENA